MKNEKYINCGEFKKEIFLFLEGSLPNGRMELMGRHLNFCSSCQSTVEDIDSVTAAYNNLPKEDIDQKSFNSMIYVATSSANRGGNFKQKRKSLVEVFGFYRLTFGGAVAAATIILIIISSIKEPDLKEVLPAYILDWHADKITNRIEKIEDRILSLKSDKWDIYTIRKIRKEYGGATLKSIHSKINNMKKSTMKKGL